MHVHQPRRARRSGRTDRERGQVIVLFALCLVAIIAMAGLLIDGGMAWANRRSAQSAADAAALAAAKAVVAGHNVTTVPNAGTGIANTNGFPTTTLNCSGATVPGVTVNRPPSSGPHSLANDPAHANDYVEVITTREMTTTFAGIVGQNCWMVSARAVASIGSPSVASCSFCSLNKGDKNHTLLLAKGDSGANLRVDGDIYVNSTNADWAANQTAAVCTSGYGKDTGYHVCGDAFDVFGGGGYISAKTIGVVGGWETHDTDITTADGLAAGCTYHPEPPSYAGLIPVPVGNVCIGMPQIPDPLNDPNKPANVINPPDSSSLTTPSAANCPSGNTFPNGTSITNITAGTHTLCPGIYNGGLAISGGTTTMLAGVYYIGGGGFAVSGSATVDGSAGVMLYNTTSTGEFDSVNPGSDLFSDGVASQTKDVGGPVLDSDAAGDTINVGAAVTYTYKFTQAGGGAPAPTGTIIFYDGLTPISACTAQPITLVAGKYQATCAIAAGTYTQYGTRYITAIYSGDTTYRPSPCSLKTPGGAGCPNVGSDPYTLTIRPPTGAVVGAGTVSISTTGGTVKLFGPSSGTYSGLTIFQGRTVPNNITLSPFGSGLASCPSGFMTTGIPTTAPPPCGALGGIQGTIYSANDSSTIIIDASGISDLQVIAGKIQVNSGTDARFAFTPGKFANGTIRLVE